MTSPGAPGGGPADSAGVPWGGRTLPYGGFEGDDGSRPPALEQALTSGDDRALVDALVPVASLGRWTLRRGPGGHWRTIRAGDARDGVEEHPVDF